MSDWHEFKASFNPRLEGTCERCGRGKTHDVHLTLLDRVEALREGFLEGRVTVEQFVERMPNGWAERDDDPSNEGRHLVRALIQFLAEYQCEKIDERELCAAIAGTR